MDISVIIPAYEKDIELAKKARQSLQDQTDITMEVIICYDSEHKGASAMRNQGLDRAQGEFVAFLDADDIGPSDPHTYHDIVAKMREMEYDIVSGDYIRRDVRAGSETTVKSMLSGEERTDNIDRDFTAFFTPGSFCYVWNKVYRKSFLDKHGLRFDDLPFAEDRDFNARCVLCSPAIFFTDKILCTYNFVSDKHRDPSGILDSFMRQAVVFEEISREKVMCRAYTYQAAYTQVFGLFFACQGTDDKTKRQLIDRACSDDDFRRALVTLSHYPKGAVLMRGMRIGVMAVSIMLRIGARGLVRRIFSLVEKKGLDRKNSPSGMMDDND